MPWDIIPDIPVSREPRLRLFLIPVGGDGFFGGSNAAAGSCTPAAIVSTREDSFGARNEISTAVPGREADRRELIVSPLSRDALRRRKRSLGAML